MCIGAENNKSLLIMERNAKSTMVVKPDNLLSTSKINIIMQKPGKSNNVLNNCCSFFYHTEFSFLIRYYNLLYQSLIPNTKLTINTLKVHLKFSNFMENYILSGKNPRIRCQRILNLLIVHLDIERDYVQFCHLINMISVMTTHLSHRLSTGTYSTYCVSMCVILLSLLHIFFLYTY